MSDQGQRAKDQTQEQKGKDYSTGSRRLERLDSISLKGRVYEVKEGESVTLESQGALLTVRQEDIREVREVSKEEKEILVASDAKIVFETLLNPQEVEGILSQDLVVEIGRVKAPTECSRCVGTECSRCVGGECECSRCVGINSPGFESPGGSSFRRKLS